MQNIGYIHAHIRYLLDRDNYGMSRQWFHLCLIDLRGL